MSTSDQQPPAGARPPGQPSTQEIPVVPPAQPAQPSAPPTSLPPPGAPTPVQPTGPVDFVPGLPGAGIVPPPPPPPLLSSAPAPLPAAGPDAPPTAPGSPPPEPPAPESSAPRGRRIVSKQPADRRSLAGVGLAVLSVVLLEVGLLLRFDTERLWSTVTLWSAFATVSAVVALLALAASSLRGSRLPSAVAWQVAAGGLVGLSVFWVLVVLPDVAGDRGFVLTAALGCLGAALWIGLRREE